MDARALLRQEKKRRLEEKRRAEQQQKFDVTQPTETTTTVTATNHEDEEDDVDLKRRKFDNGSLPTDFFDDSSFDSSTIDPEQTKDEVSSNWVESALLEDTNGRIEVEYILLEDTDDKALIPELQQEDPLNDDKSSPPDIKYQDFPGEVIDVEDLYVQPKGVQPTVTSSNLPDAFFEDPEREVKEKGITLEDQIHARVDEQFKKFQQELRVIEEGDQEDITSDYTKEGQSTVAGNVENVHSSARDNNTSASNYLVEFVESMKQKVQYPRNDKSTKNKEMEYSSPSDSDEYMEENYPDSSILFNDIWRQKVLR